MSTFSGHLVVCREMLKKLENLQSSSSSASAPIKQHAIVLLDEIGTGTDPAQGAALAQSILEELLHLNARVIVTTHYQRIKELAASDERFRIAAMEFVDNKPTYKLRYSHHSIVIVYYYYYCYCCCLHLYCITNLIT